MFIKLLKAKHIGHRQYINRLKSHMRARNAMTIITTHGKPRIVAVPYAMMINILSKSKFKF